MSQLPPALLRLNKIHSVYSIFKSVLGVSTPSKIFTESRITFSDDGKRFYEFTSNDFELAEAVLGVDFPRVATPIDLEHYTTVMALRNIVAKKKIYLKSVVYNLQFDEFKAFASEHNLDGYFDRNAKGQEVYEELAEDLYYLSMTEPGHPNEAYMWDEFAKGGRGVRLRLRVTPKSRADLRKVGYQVGSQTAYKRISYDLKLKEDLVYTPWGVSRICAFYLTGGFQTEQEVRLLIKRHKDGDDLTISNGQQKVWPVEVAPTGAPSNDPFCGIELIGIDVGPKASEKVIRDVLADTPYADVPIR